MEQRTAVSTLSSAYRDLASALAELEQAGEFAAAAHVAAALDLIESRDVDARITRNEADGSSTVAFIARQMRAAFGDVAETVARRQLAAATGPTLMAWAAIVNHITA